MICPHCGNDVVYLPSTFRFICENCGVIEPLRKAA